MDQGLPRRLSALRFRWHARFGFFLRAEASVAGYGYPVPPRTAALGVIANVLGLAKDELAETLANTRIAVQGALPATHWHNGNFRKAPPNALPYKVTQGPKEEKGTRLTRDEVNTQLRQEWLLAPEYLVTAVLPSPFHDRLESHLRAGTSIFSPCMGLSEMLASVEFVDAPALERCQAGDHEIHSVLRLAPKTTVRARDAMRASLHLLNLSMPREVTPTRRFSLETYFAERHGRPIPCTTDEAWSDGRTSLVFL